MPKTALRIVISFRAAKLAADTSTGESQEICGEKPRLRNCRKPRSLKTLVYEMGGSNATKNRAYLLVGLLLSWSDRAL